MKSIYKRCCFVNVCEDYGEVKRIFLVLLYLKINFRLKIEMKEVKR